MNVSSALKNVLGFCFSSPPSSQAMHIKSLKWLHDSWSHILLSSGDENVSAILVSVCACGFYLDLIVTSPSFQSPPHLWNCETCSEIKVLIGAVSVAPPSHPCSCLTLVCHRHLFLFFIFFAQTHFIRTGITRVAKLLWTSSCAVKAFRKSNWEQIFCD